MTVYGATALLLIASTTAFTLHGSAQTGGLTCASDDGEYHYCQAETHNQVQLERQFSGSRCKQGYSWGFDPRGIWVDRGCRAKFSYGRQQAHEDSADHDTTGALIAGGILGALIVGAAAASAANSSGDRGRDRVDYYNDGYRMGRLDSDNDRMNFPGYWNERYTQQYERDFDAGYADGYNNFGRRPPR